MRIMIKDSGYTLYFNYEDLYSITGQATTSSFRLKDGCKFDYIYNKDNTWSSTIHSCAMMITKEEAEKEIANQVYNYKLKELLE